ncbi:MAG: cyclic nucleotide-binding domain-containing protein, partial [Nitrospinota bacterium]
RVISFKELLAKVRHIPFLRSLKRADIEYIYENAEFYEMPSQTTIIRQSDAGASVFLLFSGRAAAERNDKNNVKRYLAKFKEGEFFGEGAFFRDGIRSASITLTTRSKLIEFKTPLLKKLLNKYSDLYELLYKTYVERSLNLKTQIQKSIEMLRKDPRITIKGDAKFQLGGKSGTSKKVDFGFLKDLSMGGCRIETDGAIFRDRGADLIGRKIPVKIKLPEGQGTIEAIGKIAWCEQASGMDVFGYRYFFGINFVKLSKSSGETLKKVCGAKRFMARQEAAN